MNLWLVDIASGKQTAVDQATMNEIRAYAYAPDSEWITYTKESANGQSAVWVYHIPSAKATQLTDDQFDDYNPVFSKDGKFIFFVSNRDFNLDFSSFEFDYLYNEASRLYAVALRNDGTKLKSRKNDVETVKEEKAEAPKKDEPKDKNPKIPSLPLRQR